MTKLALWWLSIFSMTKLASWRLNFQHDKVGIMMTKFSVWQSWHYDDSQFSAWQVGIMMTKFSVRWPLQWHNMAPTPQCSLSMSYSTYGWYLISIKDTWKIMVGNPYPFMLLHPLAQAINIEMTWEGCIICSLSNSIQNYHKISNTRCNKFQNLNVSPLVLQLSLPNLLKPGVKSGTKM